MSLISNSPLLDLAGIISALIIVIVSYIKWKERYWARRNMPYLKSTLGFSLINRKINKISVAERIKYLYDEMKEKEFKFCGANIMSEPILIINDLDLLKNILTKDFNYFTDRGLYCNEKDDPLTGHLFSVGGKKWRNLRVKLTPSFTSGKLRYMFLVLVNCSKLLEELMNEKCEKNEVLDIKEILGCFTTDIIGSCAFGLDCNTFKDPNSPFRVYGKKVFIPDFVRIVKSIMVTNYPNVCKYFGLKITPKDVEKFFMGIVKDTVEYREKNNIERKDFLQLLMDLKNNNQALEVDGHEGSRQHFGLKELSAQCFVFFLAGFETSSSLMTFTLYELALAQNIQEKLRQEIKTVLKKYDGEITYDGIKEMTYLHQVLQEGLRKYPPVPVLRRSCSQEYQIPNTNYVIEKDTKIFVPVYGIHYDPDYYPEPEKFDPERFNEENKHKRHPYAYLPFGEGPRNCIGLRFGLMQSKVGLISILRNHKILLNSKTVNPMKLSPTFVLAVKGGVWLNLEKIEIK